MRVTLLVLSFLCLATSCKKEGTINSETENQPSSIAFIEEDLENAKSIAKKENKLIFIDCYTTWCIPCKWMEQNVFVDKNVIEYYNENFINLKLDMEKGIGPELVKKFRVNAYPTYAFINSNGDLIHKGRSTMLPEEFVQMGKDALSPSKAYGILYNKFEADNISKDELLELTTTAYSLGEKRYPEYYEKLMNEVDDTFLASEKGFKLIQSFVYNEEHELFKTLRNNEMKYREMVGDSAVNRVYTLCLLQNISKNISTMDEKRLQQDLDSLKNLGAFPTAIAGNHLRYYLMREDAEKVNEVSNKYINEYFENDANSIEYLARTTYRMGKENKNILNEADKLITMAYQIEPNNLTVLNSYIQIKNELGDKEEAIEKAKLAVKISDTVGQIEKDKALKTLEQLNGSI